MKTAQSLAILTAYSLGFCLQFATEAGAAPFVPIEWQQRVKAGALEDQRKHIGWNRDVNQNFVDDVLDALPPADMVTVIVQMNECLPRADIVARLGRFGTIRRIGTLVSYVVLDNVLAGDVAELAKDPAVAAVEHDELAFATHDISTRGVRARASATFSPETFANLPGGFTGSGISVAVVDTGVDDAVHGAFAGKFVSGYNAITATPMNPDCDDASVPFITTGANGICNTTAAGDDVQIVPVGQGFPDPNAFGAAVRAILPGANGVIDTVPAGDDSTSTVSCGGVTPYLRPGPDGICNSTAAGDDIQVIPVGQGWSDVDPPGVGSGANGVIDTVPAGDDIIFPGVWHGTHVAGTIMGLGIGPGCRPADDTSVPNNCAGMATGASLVDVKVLDSSGSGFTSDIIDGLEWIWTDGNARVVNMSLGNSSDSDGTSTASKVINALVENNITVVVTAGNDGANCLGTWASSELAITVAAADDHGTVDRDDYTFASFSTFGPRVDFTGVPVSEVRIGQLKPDIAAPGVHITSTQGDSASSYHALSGTSMAAPVVAGAVALLLDKRPELPPGSLKELLKRTAYMTPQHAALGPSFPAIDGAYNTNWGFGLLDVYQAAVNLDAGIADISFTACTGPGSSCPGNCEIPGANYANSTDILLATDPPERGEPNIITINVENRTGTPAENVVICVGVKELGAGLNQFYDVGCKTIDIGALAVASVTFPWTPTSTEHQCIQATINYGFDTDFCNNQTQRNTDTVPASSTATVTFRVENPFNETATIILTPTFAGGNDSVRGNLKTNQFTLRPEDCAVFAQMDFTPNPALPIGTRATFNVDARAITASHPEGVELSGVQFNVVVVAAGLERAYSVGRHGPEGRINLRLNLAGLPTTDPRLTVNEILAVFNVTVGPTNGTLSPQQVLITSSAGNPIPPYTVAFAGGGNRGQELTILFSQPLANRDRYRISFARFVDTDGDPLRGDTDLEFRVLQGDVNSSGAVTGTDVSFVRGRINQQVAFGETTRADPNMTGAITGPDISFVRSRIGNSAP